MTIEYMMFKFWITEYEDINKLITFNKNLLYTQYTLCTKYIPILISYGYNIKIQQYPGSIIIWVDKGNFTQS